jgi:hypothetical protein
MAQAPQLPQRHNNASNLTHDKNTPTHPSNATPLGQRNTAEGPHPMQAIPGVRGR